MQSTLTKTRVAPDLLAQLSNQTVGREKLKVAVNPSFDVIVELNDRFPGGSQVARAQVLAAYEKSHPISEMTPADAAAFKTIRVPPDDVGEALKDLFEAGDKISVQNSLWTSGYLLARLGRETIDRLSKAEGRVGDRTAALVYKIWSEHRVQRCIYASAKTIKCDAAKAAFAAAGDGIVWAVADTGVDGGHPHFSTHGTLDLPDGLLHRDFTQTYDNDTEAAVAALVDLDGHGTHVSGIIAGETLPSDHSGNARRLVVHREERISDTETTASDFDYGKPISGMAPLCKIVSLKVLATGESGSVGSLLAAIGYVQTMNEFGRDIKIHGLNLSLGYGFDPEWFAAGQSPLCGEVNRLVRAGVVVVIAAGNAGMTTITTYNGTSARAAQEGTIADPGNADLAITVGSTHRDAPHTYGISYFSAKGPTADGRMKPDLVAPGERIVSCALTGASANSTDVPFREDSGTSMAAPHVSGAAAAFLSVRREFIGQPDRLKEILVGSATDLKRRPEFQGAGLVDVMRALQSV